MKGVPSGSSPSSAKHLESLFSDASSAARVYGETGWWASRRCLKDTRMRAQDRDIKIALDALCDVTKTIRVKYWPGMIESLNLPGLYAWQVDEEGAADLSKGLGVEVQSNLIYAGQAGATKWPSGSRSDQTLRGRIQSNHLNGNVRGSTFRRTLAACLVERLALGPLRGSPRSLAPGCEKRLSAWIRNHLSVTVFGFVDRDLLKDLEARVLNILDPPLNLDGMRSSLARSRLSRLRRELFAPDAPEVSHSSNAFASVTEERLDFETPRRVTLHEEIADILEAAANQWMTAKEIAQAVNTRTRYQKRDGSPVQPFQIHGRTRNYEHLFERDGQRVRLIRYR